jgi:hypothetical protein
MGQKMVKFILKCNKCNRTALVNESFFEQGNPMSCSFCGEGQEILHQYETTPPETWKAPEEPPKDSSGTNPNAFVPQIISAGHCGYCGAPFTYPNGGIHWGVIPPKPIPTCDCWNTGETTVTITSGDVPPLDTVFSDVTKK